MKSRRISSSIFLIALFAFLNSVIAQTKQIELHASFNNGMVWCLNKPLSGEWTYHVTYHVNKKTGIVDNLHWNIKHCDLWDSDGNKYIVIDTGNDNLAVWWDFFNNITAYTGDAFVYDLEDGWLPVPDVLPIEGSFVNMFKFIGNGEVVSMSFVVQLHRNANGEYTANVDKATFNCN